MQHEGPENSSGRKRSRVRLLVRIISLLAAVATLWVFVSRWVPSLSPFVGLSVATATRRLSAVACLGVLVGIAAMVKPRVFCRWICPLGLCLEGAGGLGRRLKRRPGRWPSLGPWIVLLTLGGACLGHPLMLWLDPLALFAGGGFVLVLAATVVWPGVWCGRVCPLGAFQDLLRAGFTSARSLVGFGRATDVDAGLSRRVILGVAAGAGSAGILGLVRKNGPRPLRPPNARTETQFSSLCTRCTEVCPSGAIGPLHVRDKAKIRIGLPRVDAGLCLLSDDRECSACARWCPYGAIRYVFSETTYSLGVQIDPQKCNGCGACEAACPTKPRKAIVVLPV
jgi:Fe-S-cluster-containing hydrogenase component 2